MKIAHVSERVFLTSGAYVLLCIPGILLAERFHWPQWPFHVSQLIMVVVCFIAAAVFFWLTRGTPIRLRRGLAMLALILAGLWLALFVFVAIAFTLSAKDF